MQCSKDTVCGICMKVACEKASTGERGFGILSSCSHTYCLKCIHKWKGTKLFESKIIVSYPECRVTSNFVIPSEYWVGEIREAETILMKDGGAAYLGGCVFTSRYSLMAIERIETGKQILGPVKEPLLGVH